MRRELEAAGFLPRLDDGNFANIKVDERGKIMKRLFLISICIVFVMASAALHAQEKKAPLGKGNFAVKLDYITFTDGFFDKSGREDDGLYIGLEGYGRIYENLYLGGEVGGALNITIFGEEISFVPIELNAKYAIELVPNLAVDFGAGVSYSYAKLEDLGPFGSGKERSDWLFGGQFFADLTYRINWFSIGINTKYQITQSFRDEGFDLGNWRIGAQMGIVF